jgi:uncharacterized protein (TIGR00730 family)
LLEKSKIKGAFLYTYIQILRNKRMLEFFKNIGRSLKIGAHFLKASLQLVYGAWKISALPQPIISIFGGSRLKKDSPYLQQAHILANMLIEQNISVITGGGPGIMEAASCGASHAQPGIIRTMGIGVIGLKGEEKPNRYVRNALLMDYFFARKYLLINYSLGFVVFPGGFGTMDELTELLTHIQTGKLKPAPIILIGTEFWKDFFKWIEVAREHALLSHEETDLITITNDLERAVQILKNQCTACLQEGITHL